MPPWLPAPGDIEFIGERRLSEAQITVFTDWLTTGMPEGDPALSPPTPVWPGGWDLGPPDLVVTMPSAYAVPATGPDIYRHFVIPVPLKRRRYVAAWQFIPRSRAVHHAFIRLDRSGQARRHDAADPDPGFPGMDTPAGIELPEGHFSSWQPGAAPRRIQPGLSWALDPGVDLVIQMHLQPLGRMESLKADIGFYFTDQPPTNHLFKVALGSFDIDLPPGSSNVVVTDQFVLPGFADLLGLLPHTHYLGRRVEARAILPAGAQKTLLLIPEWDFNWQGDYICRTPVRLPAGTRVLMEISFDNSTNNPRNPFHPPRRVRYGPSTTDEMAEIWLQLLPATPDDAKHLSEANDQRTLRDTYAANEQRLRINPSDAQALVNLGRVHMARRQFEQARQRFIEAAAANPALDDPHYHLGVLYRLSGQLKAALAAFSRAVQLNPENARAHGNLGLIHLTAGRVDPAARHFEEAIRLNPKDSLALSTLGTLRLEQGRAAEAESLLARALSLQPRDAEIRRLLDLARQELRGR
jgi:tetratricopeptide (TPR) repeat protein